MSNLAQPPGCRSCGLGGTWSSGDAELAALQAGDVRQILRSLPNDLERSMWRQETFRSTHRAEAGKLRTAPTGDDVKKMSSTEDVLRIKLGPRRTADGTRIHTRIYFTEPDTHDGLLLGLSIRAKHDDPAGKPEQDAHAREAQDRCDRWHQRQ